MAELGGGWDDLPALLRGEPPTRPPLCAPLPGFPAAEQAKPIAIHRPNAATRGINAAATNRFVSV